MGDGGNADVVTRGVRRLLALVLSCATALVPIANAAPAGAAEFLISIPGASAFAPGARVPVSVSGGASQAFVAVSQCGADASSCGPDVSAALDGSGAGEVLVTIRRLIGSEGHLTDCAHTPCRLVAREFDTGAEADADITVDGSAPIPRPVLAVSATKPLTDRAAVDVVGHGFEPDTAIEFIECAWTDSIRCLDGSLAFGTTDGDGGLSVRVPVLRTLDGIDCAQRRGRCQVWAIPYGNLDHIAAVGLTFDPSSPTVQPQASVNPSTVLRDGQQVTVTGRDFLANNYAYLEQCAHAGDAGEECRYLADVSLDQTGGFASSATVRRRVGLEDCAAAACVVRVNGSPFDRVDVPIGFDSSVPPPPAPTLSVSPNTGLVDWQVVDVQLHDFEPGSYVQLQLCTDADGSTGENATCKGSISVSVSDANQRVDMALPRVLATNVDCAEVSCAVRAQLFGSQGVNFVRTRVQFDPDAPLLGGEAVMVLPNAGLWDRQHVELRGQRLEPGEFVQIRECVDADATACAPNPPSVSVDSRGELSERVMVRRTLSTPTGTQDCAAVTCFLLVDGNPRIAVALAFDPRGPLVGTDLPPQLSCVPWPTGGWPTGPIPAGVDPTQVERVGTKMVEPGGADSVVVIHGGRLVYENYADGITADTIEPSFSMSKSFTSTMIGLLVDEGKLQLDERAPIDEWSGTNDPRRAITLRNLLNMSSGLQWSENYSGPGDVISMVVSPDGAAYTVARPLQFAPGAHFNYSTGDTEVLGKIIGETVGVSGDTYAQYLHARLFDPLGIAPVDPGFDQAGTWNAGFKTNTTTRNFAKLGLLYLRNGVWENKQFVSSKWVDFVRTPAPTYSGYGGQFWLDSDGSFRMVGLYGQTVHIIPDLDLIIAVNNGSGDFEMADAFRNVAPASCGSGALAYDDTATVTALGSVDADVLANDEGGEIGFATATLTVSRSPEHGRVEAVGGKLRYHSDPGFTGVDRLAYVVCTRDRRQCPEANVSVTVEPLPFAFRAPAGSRVHRRLSGHAILVSFRTSPGAIALANIASVPVDCDSGAALGAPELVETEVHAQRRFGTAWFWWETDRTWTGCRDLRITLGDGVAHASRFRWRQPGL